MLYVAEDQEAGTEVLVGLEVAEAIMHIAAAIADVARAAIEVLACM